MGAILEPKDPTGRQVYTASFPIVPVGGASVEDSILRAEVADQWRAQVWREGCLPVGEPTIEYLPALRDPDGSPTEIMPAMYTCRGEVEPAVSEPFEPKHPCREMPTRPCPLVYGDVCGARLCARFESDDEAPWLPEMPPRPWPRSS